MSKKEELLIQTKVQEMIVWAYGTLKNFPKSETHVLSAHMRDTMYEILQKVLVVNRRYHKKTTMQDLDANLDFLRSLIIIARDLSFLKFKQYETWSRQIEEIGRMIGGWLKWARSQ